MIRAFIRFFLTIIGWPMEKEYQMSLANTNSLRKVMPVIEVNTGELKKGDQVKAYVKAGPGGKKWLEGLVLSVDKDFVQVGIPGLNAGVVVRKAFVKRMRAMRGSVYKKVQSI